LAKDGGPELVSNHFTKSGAHPIIALPKAKPIDVQERGVMKVLMGIDDSQFSGIVTRAVVTQLRAGNTEVLVLHVLQPVEPVPPPEMSTGYAPELDDEKKAAHALVEQIAGKLRAAGFKAETTIKVGDPTLRIIETASEWKADLIVLGSHGQRGLRNFLLGSVSESVARDAKCSVEIARGPEES
jgi:nucleotide-binding universal stress UspA family protein